MTNGQKLRKLREAIGLTQEQLAERIRVSKRTIQRWETGVRHCPDAIVMLVETYL